VGNMINVLIIQGNLTRDPELRYTPSGTAVVNARIAHNDSVKDASGQWVDKPYFFDVTIWGARGEAFARHFTKGKPVLIEGRLTWREWQAQDGTNRQAVEIVADKWFFVGSKRDGDGDVTTRYGDSDYSRGGGDQYVPASAASAPADDFAPADDDIPF
jgi:single-strand DNA-binding protein